MDLIQHPKAERRSADDVALELLKQVITLSVAVLAFTGTFVERIGSVPAWSLWLLVAAWISFLVAIGSALRSISAIVKARLNPDFDWSTGVGRTYAMGSQIGFALGLVMFLTFASFGLFHSSDSRSNSDNNTPIEVEAIIPD